MIETTNMLKELYRIFDAINDEYFDSSLPKVFITLQQGKKKTKSTYGTFYPESWAEVEGKEINEETGVEVFDQALQILDKEVQKGKVGYFRTDSQANRVYYIHDKAVTLCGEAGGGAAKMGQYLFGCITPDRVNKRQNGQRFNKGNKFYTLTAQDKHGILVEGYIRKLTPIECERLQTLPDNYTYGISTTQRYKALGNGWTVDVIAHILSFLPNKFKIEGGMNKCNREQF